MPLELPAIESPSVASGLAPDGGPPQDVLYQADPKQLDAVGWRMLNLPLIVCQSANGMPFFFPLQKVLSSHASCAIAQLETPLQTYMGSSNMQVQFHRLHTPFIVYTPLSSSTHPFHRLHTPSIVYTPLSLSDTPGAMTFPQVAPTGYQIQAARIRQKAPHHIRCYVQGLVAA